jgi:hypothetical protein
VGFSEGLLGGLRGGLGGEVREGFVLRFSFLLFGFLNFRWTMDE